MSHWKKLGPREKIPERAGCYVICNRERVYYIGRTSNFRQRFGNHGFVVNLHGVETREWGSLGGCSLKIRPSSKYAEELMIEARLIHRLRPVFNVTGNPVYDTRPEPLTALRLDADLMYRLRLAAAQERTSMKALAEEFISRGLAQLGSHIVIHGNIFEGHTPVDMPGETV